MSEVRLIDANALFNWGKYKLSDAVKYGNKDEEQRHFSYGTLMMYEIADEIDSAPTIAPVRGEWEEMRNYYGELEGFMCGCGHQSQSATRYCPNCGSKMGGEG